MTPELKFSLDGTEISEGDAVSYVMFGRSLDELTYGQQSAVADETPEPATDVAQEPVTAEAEPSEPQVEDESAEKKPTEASPE